MRLTLPGFLVLLLATAGTAGPDPSPVVLSERAFARMAVEKGKRDAFLTYLAEDSVLFRPRPTPGRKAYSDNPSPPGVLTWVPAFAAISRAGDLGWSTGPWELRKAQGDDTDVLFGDYVSVWKKQTDGSWKVEIDLGVIHKPPETKLPGLTPIPPDGSTAPPVITAVDTAAAKESLRTADRSLAELVSKSGSAKAAADLFRAAANDDVRVVRPDAFTAVGKGALANAWAASEGVLAWTPDAVDVSLSGDLGYTYGSATVRAATPPVAGPGKPPPATGEVASYSYVRIWTRGIDGGWMIALDVALPIPKT